MVISQKKYELLKKIIKARLSANEIKLVSDKADEILKERMNKGKRPGGGQLHEINLYNETDVDGIAVEALKK